jgi:hypothetical protein
MPQRVITQVTLENFHEHVPEYIHGNNIMIQNYEDTKEVYLGMLRNNYLFTFDRDILIACLTDLTYMYAPGDDVNKDAVIDLLVLEGEESECEDDDEEEEIDCGVNDSIDRRIDFPTDVDSSSEPCVSGM